MKSTGWCNQAFNHMYVDLLIYRFVKEANSRKKKVYEQQENEENPLRCPVKLYEFYLSKWYAYMLQRLYNAFIALSILNAFMLQSWKRQDAKRRLLSVARAQLRAGQSRVVLYVASREGAPRQNVASYQNG